MQLNRIERLKMLLILQCVGFVLFAGLAFALRIETVLAATVLVVLALGLINTTLALKTRRKSLD